MTSFLHRCRFARRRLTTTTTVDAEEVSKFGRLASHWWNENGREFGALHRMNRVRVPFIRESLSTDANTVLPLEGKRFLDVGCGGGILSEALARLGASVTGVDASEENIGAAQLHAQRDPDIARRVQYTCSTVESLVGTETYDCVVASEVVEHVADVPTFVRSCVELTEPGGRLVFTTLTRTAWSFAAGIVAAEFLLGLVPPGTHDWSKFLTPNELSAELEAHGANVMRTQALRYDPLCAKWHRGGPITLNYALAAQRMTTVPVAGSPTDNSSKAASGDDEHRK